MIALADSQARRWEPTALRYRLFSIGSRLGRRNHLYLASATPFAALTVAAIATLTRLDTG